MLNVKLGAKGPNYVEASGDLKSVLCDVINTVMAVHQAIAKTDDKAAELFRVAIEKSVTDPDFWKLDLPGVTIARSERR